MILLRSALYILYLLVTLVPWALVAVVFSIFVRGAPMYWLCVGWLKAAVWGAKAICGVHYRVQGLQHLPSAADAHAAVLLAPKHQSTWETFAFPASMPHPLAYVFKRELLWIPFFGWAIGRMDMIHIDRSQRARAWGKVLAQGKRLMGQGNWVIMFPEGTRIDRGQKGDYQSGAARLAVTTGTPIVPIAVTSARCWPRGMRVPSGNMMTQLPRDISDLPWLSTLAHASVRRLRSMWIMSMRQIAQPKNGIHSNSRLKT